MKSTPALALAAGLLAAVAATGPGTALAAGDPGNKGGAAMEQALKVGDMAPSFSLPGSDGKTYSLDQFKGKEAVVIAWFPKAFTGG